MFPYRDENPTEKPAIITVAIIIANALVFILIQGAGAQGPLARSVCELGLILSGVLGAYLLLYPRVRVHTLIILPIYITSVALPAWVMLGYWAVLQLLSGLAGLREIEKGGVAFFAHVGGFIAGLVLIRLFASEEVLRRRPTPPAGYYRYRSFG